MNKRGFLKTLTGATAGAIGTKTLAGPQTNIIPTDGVTETAVVAMDSKPSMTNIYIISPDEIVDRRKFEEKYREIIQAGELIL